MAEKIRIDFVSDVACPWCVIGLRSLSQALDSLKGEVEAEIHFQPFELNPQMPPEGENTFEHVQKKYGSTQEKSAAAREMIRQSGEALGFTFNYGPDSRIWNTFAAHRLLHWAGLAGRQRELKEALFVSNFTEGQPTNDVDALVEAAVKAGLDGPAAREVLVSGRYTDEVRVAEEAWIRAGISAVPSVIFERKWLVQGGQPPEAFEQAIRNVIAQRTQQPATA
jgi:predicted DsbA family dithiol-disulfide isomerase